MITIALDNMMKNCPVYWQNFIRHLREVHPYFEDGGFPTSVINKELDRYDATYTNRKETNREIYSRLDFHDERKYTMFMLKYGSPK